MAMGELEGLRDDMTIPDYARDGVARGKRPRPHGHALPGATRDGAASIFDWFYFFSIEVETHRCDTAVGKVKCHVDKTRIRCDPCGISYGISFN